MGLQLGDEVAGGVTAGASGVDEDLGVSMETLNSVGVIVSLGGSPGAGDGGGALRATVKAVDSLRLCRRTQTQNFTTAGKHGKHSGMD